MSLSLVTQHDPLVTVLTPTFNDAGYLPILLASMLEQTYSHWEWIIIDDGSTDETPGILAALADPRIRVLRKENGDQLNALAYALPHIKGALVTIIHSDDQLVAAGTIASCVASLLESDADGIYGDYQTMDGEGRLSGILPTPVGMAPNLARKTVAHMGTNFIGDHFFVRRAAFESHIVPNYIRLNTIYYFNYEGLGTLRLKKVPAWYQYRVFAENYINSDVGKFVALSGQFRTVTRLVNAGAAPASNVIFGYAGFRLARRVGLCAGWPRLSKQSFGSEFFGFWAHDLQRYGYPSLLIKIAKAIAHSYAVAQRRSEALVWSANPSLDNFKPADARRFFRHSETAGIPAPCLLLLNMTFDHIVVADELALDQVNNWLSFFSLQYPVVRTAA